MEDATSRKWILFHPWQAQIETLDVLEKHNKVAILKARQLGFSWLAIAWALWHMLFKPAATILLFSKRDDEAVELLAHRLRGMFDRLPAYMKDIKPQEAVDLPRLPDGMHKWQLPNGSRALAFPNTGGRSYTGSIAIVDECDYLPDLNKLLDAVEPTVEAGGKLVLLSTSDKSKPESPFKKIYRAAAAGENNYRPVFYGWQARPDRTVEWYEGVRRDKVAKDGSLDGLHEQYPATDLEALAPRSMDKRIHADWLMTCFQPMAPRDQCSLGNDAPAIPILMVYHLPVAGHRYVVGLDPAEGNPTSDDSALEVIDTTSGEEVACLAAKLQPEVLAAHGATVATWYNRAQILCERNNHGHACILWLKDNSCLKLVTGRDKKPGWTDDSKGKSLLYDECSRAFRECDVVLHNRKTYEQLQSIEGSTLRAPEGQADDCADAFALAILGKSRMQNLGSPPLMLNNGLGCINPHGHANDPRYQWR